ncbi:hypothetical protein BpHYR1_051454 [Brachionus plicatilis]|uniref:Uncharacterized protein n=1 Tax=Brachionus plicatilis TaxID=10195 RepID=A0A3M7SUP7_BRAPC|nr:hypothetical protein BpHYR1_051454 [Brachionus plicatilis]
MVANDCNGSGMALSDSSITSTCSPLPKYTRPMPKAKNLENVSLSSCSLLSNKVCIRVEVISPLALPTPIRPRERAATPITSILADESDKMRDGILSILASVRNTKTKNGRYANAVVLVIDIVGQQSQGWIAFVLYTGVHDAARQQRARLHIIFVRVQVLVDLSEAVLDVPQRQQTKSGRGAHNAVLFVLVNPHIGLFVVAHQFVFGKGSVHKAVDKRGGQILTRRVHLRLVRSARFQMTLVNVLGHFGLHDVEFARQIQKILTQTRIVHYFCELVGVLDP